MAIIALLGPPGTGKTSLCMTTHKTPVHVIDIDRKIRAMNSLQPYLTNHTLTYKEVGETLNEGGLKARLDSLVKADKASKPPLGWTNIAGYIETLERDEQAKAARTITIDSTTQLRHHIRAHMQYIKGEHKFVFDQWTAWGQLWAEITTIMIDYCLTCCACGKLHKSEEQYDHPNDDKDLIMIFHERVSEKPGKDTTKVRVTHDAKTGMRQREYSGSMNVNIAASIEGQFGLEFGTYFTDVYQTHVDMVDGKPVWKVRVLPDGQRDLRCSYDVKGVAEHDPNLAKIWGIKK